MARKNRQWAEAERLQLLSIEWDRQRTAPFLNKPSAGKEHHLVRTLAANLHELGEIQRECQQPACVKTYEESLTLLEQIGEQADMAGLTRHNVAIVLRKANRFLNALEYARAALLNFQSYPHGTEAEIQKTEKLIGDIEKDLEL